MALRAAGLLLSASQPLAKRRGQSSLLLSQVIIVCDLEADEGFLAAKRVESLSQVLSKAVMINIVPSTKKQLRISLYRSSSEVSVVLVWLVEVRIKMGGW